MGASPYCFTFNDEKKIKFYNVVTRRGSSLNPNGFLLRPPQQTRKVRKAFRNLSDIALYKIGLIALQEKGEKHV